MEKNTYKDNDRGFEINFPQTWGILPTEDADVKVYGTPFMYILPANRIEDYKRGLGMGANLNLGYVKRLSQDDHRDFELQRKDLKKSLRKLLFKENEYWFDDNTMVGKVEGTMHFPGLKNRIIQYYFYRTGDDPIILTSIFSPKEKDDYKGVLEIISTSFKFLN